MLYVFSFVIFLTVVFICRCVRYVERIFFFFFPCGLVEYERTLSLWTVAKSQQRDTVLQEYQSRVQTKEVKKKKKNENRERKRNYIGIVEEKKREQRRLDWTKPDVRNKSRFLCKRGSNIEGFQARERRRKTRIYIHTCKASFM